MFPTKLCLSLVAAAGLMACSGESRPVAGGEARAGAEPGYMVPPGIVQATLQGEAMVLTGEAAPMAQIRLATPAGEALTATSDRQGAWTLSLPRPAEAQIFGLSMALPARQVQAQGYVLVTPRGQAALLRAGTGAVRLDALPDGVIGAFDFDQDGGAVLSGTAPADAVVSIRLDGRQTAEGRADAAGRYVVQLPRISPGEHRLDVLGDAFTDTVSVAVSAAEPLVAGPLRTQVVAGGLRADWLTPGGGVQSTVIID